MSTGGLTSAQVADALLRSGGLLAGAAKLLGCGRTTVHRHIKSDPALAEVQREAREQNVDIAEFKLLEAIQAGEPWAIQFYLRCIAKSRGYVERQEQQHLGETAVRVIFGPAPVAPAAPPAEPTTEPAP